MSPSFADMFGWGVADAVSAAGTVIRLAKKVEGDRQNGVINTVGHSILVVEPVRSQDLFSGSVKVEVNRSKWNH